MAYSQPYKKRDPIAGNLVERWKVILDYEDREATLTIGAIPNMGTTEILDIESFGEATNTAALISKKRMQG